LGSGSFYGIRRSVFSKKIGGYSYSAPVTMYFPFYLVVLVADCSSVKLLTVLEY
jgi:hypothetical protein